MSVSFRRQPSLADEVGDRLSSASSSHSLCQNGNVRKHPEESNMHIPAPSLSTNVLAIVVFITSCSSSDKPVVDPDVAEFVGVPSNEMKWRPIPDGEGILTVTLVGDPSERGPLVAR